MIILQEEKKYGGKRILSRIQKLLKEDSKDKELKKVEKILKKNEKKSIKDLRKLVEDDLQAKVKNELENQVVKSVAGMIL